MAKCKLCPYKQTCRDECYGEQPCYYALAFEKLARKIERKEARIKSLNSKLHPTLTEETRKQSMLVQTKDGTEVYSMHILGDRVYITDHSDYAKIHAVYSLAYFNAVSRMGG